MIGIYGGTFDPVHFGHLRTALEILEALPLSQLRFIPCGQPPHREAPHATAAQRVKMLQHAIAGVPGFVCDTREVERSGPSYMIDTLRSLHHDLPEQNLCLIIGMDAFAAFHTWKDWRAILQQCNLLIMHRPEFEPERVIQNPALKSLVATSQADEMPGFVASKAGQLLFLPVTQLDISSTRIREAVRNNSNVRYLLPDAVIEFIQQERIYH